MLKEVAKRTGLVGRLRGRIAAEIEIAVRPLRQDVDRLARAVDSLAHQQQLALERAAHIAKQSAQIKTALRLNDRQRSLLATLDARLDADRVVAHVHRAIESTSLVADPFPHIVVSNLLPDDVYDLAVAAIPPQIFFSERDPTKQDLRIPFDFGPVVSTRVWDFVDTSVARDAIRPIVLQKFAGPLEQHYDVIFGRQYRERAQALPQAVSGGRLMLRRAGYHLDPHRDPKRTLLTCLLYLARPHDSEAYGTQIFRVEGDHEPTYTQTYYPGRYGATCTLLKIVPFRPNTALIFLNSGGAHGADIPATVSRKVERYAFQFYVGPDYEGLDPLISDLPPERRALWRSREDLESEPD